LRPRDCKTLAGHHPFTRQARAPRPVPASSQELLHEVTETHPKSCSGRPGMPPAPMQPAELHTPHPTARPGPAAGCEKVKRDKHPCLGAQPRTACRCSSPRRCWELLSIPSSTQSTSQPGPACTRTCLRAAQGRGQTELCSSRVEKETRYARKSHDGCSGCHLHTFTLPMSRLATTGGHP